MTEVDKYKKILKELKGKPLREKNIRVAGIVTDYVKNKHGFDLIVVGGLSVEYYTDGGYATQDIDFVGPGHEEIMECLVDLGFKREGKDSIYEELKVYVEVPSSTLNQGDIENVNKVVTEDGYTVNFIGIEDIFWDRVRATVHNKEMGQLNWLKALYNKHKNIMDMEYIKSNLTPKELEFVESLIQILDRTNESKSKTFDLKLFMDSNNIVYSTVGDDFIVLSVLNGYFGLTFYPMLMLYQYDQDDEEFYPMESSEMTPKEICYLLENIDTQNKYNFKKLGNKIMDMYSE